MGKVLFFDIDGTLLSFTQSIAESTKKALKAAQANGHKIYICSGRSKMQLQKEILDLPFDGFVLLSGAYTEKEGRSLSNHPIEREALSKLIQILDSCNALYTAMSVDKAYINSKNKPRQISLFSTNAKGKSEDFDRFVNALSLDDAIEKRDDIAKIVYRESGLLINEMQERLTDNYELTGLSFEGLVKDGGEITGKGIHKAHGMEIILDSYGLTKKDCIAFGDGPNDFEMIDYAGIGVAMGNAIPTLKERADYITDDVDHDGIYHALQHLALI